MSENPACREKGSTITSPVVLVGRLTLCCVLLRCSSSCLFCLVSNVQDAAGRNPNHADNIYSCFDRLDHVVDATTATDAILSRLSSRLCYSLIDCLIAGQNRNSLVMDAPKKLVHFHDDSFQICCYYKGPVPTQPRAFEGSATPAVSVPAPSKVVPMPIWPSFTGCLRNP